LIEFLKNIEKIKLGNSLSKVSQNMVEKVKLLKIEIFKMKNLKK
jgi:hypothetical protein